METSLRYFVVLLLLGSLSTIEAIAGVTYVPLARCEFDEQLVYISLPAHDWKGPFPAVGIAVTKNAVADASSSSQFFPVQVHQVAGGSYYFDFIGYSAIPDRDQSNCEILEPGADGGEREDIISLTMQGHFVDGSYDWDDPRSLKELERACLAIPLEFSFRCGHSPQSKGPMFCNWIEIVESIIPVDSGSCRGL